MRVPLHRRKDLRRLMAAGIALMMLASAVPAMAQGAPAANPAPLPEPSAAQVQLSKELLNANGEGKSFDSLIPGIIEQAAGSFVQGNPDLIRELRDVGNSLLPEFEKRKGEIVDILARTYSTYFTEAELRDMLEFYRSPTGRKLVEKRQAMLDTGLRSVQQWGAKLAKEMEERVRQEMKKRGFTI